MVSSINSFTEQNGRNTTVVMDKQEAVGHGGGSLFDSGCNLSGVSKVHISYHGRDRNSNFIGTCVFSAIERIFLEFKKPLQQSEPKVPFYSWKAPKPKVEKRKFLTEQIFEVDDNDPIVRIDVWTDYFVNAIQFHLESGLISQLYGVPDSRSETKPPISFKRKCPDSQLLQTT